MEIIIVSRKERKEKKKKQYQLLYTFAPQINVPWWSYAVRQTKVTTPNSKHVLENNKNETSKKRKNIAHSQKIHMIRITVHYPHA